MILSMPAYIFYFNGNGNSEQSSLKTFFSELSLGNIGQCKFLALAYKIYSSIRM